MTCLPKDQIEFEDYSTIPGSTVCEPIAFTAVQIHMIGGIIYQVMPLIEAVEPLRKEFELAYANEGDTATSLIKDLYGMLDISMMSTKNRVQTGSVLGELSPSDF